MHDVTIIGGSYAGAAAALQLGRARRSVLVVDAGSRRNRFASHSHGFLGSDGASPSAIAEKARAEVLAYPTVRWLEGTVREARPIAGGFAVRVGAEDHHSKRLILATGVADELPAVPGLADRWGNTVFHCPYCHGYELGRGRLGVLGTHALGIHHALLVSEWAGERQTTLFLERGIEPEAEERKLLEARSVRIERTRVIAIGGEAPAVEVRLEDGRSYALDGLFVTPRTRLSDDLASQLGCELEAGPAGPFYKTDATKETTVPGIFACGDAGLAMGTVSFAVADGARAGMAAHRSLVFRS
ncbi:MAG TPA: NAD(P)/FAD-dependent oxidoreductase [Polyangiales bacterium]|nr:NAD(P)/FAD-dependent oxidoreductase [Polyangiales bacterium]